MKGGAFILIALAFAVVWAASWYLLTPEKDKPRWMRERAARSRRITKRQAFYVWLACIPVFALVGIILDRLGLAGSVQ